MAGDHQLRGYAEVAAHLGISAGAAHSRKSRGACCPTLKVPMKRAFTMPTS